jgi:hypothetical protein
MLLGEFREVSDDRFRRHAGREVAEHVVHREARANEHRAAATNPQEVQGTCGADVQKVVTGINARAEMDLARGVAARARRVRYEPESRSVLASESAIGCS